MSETRIRTSRKVLEIDTGILERVESYAKAHRLDPDALIAAAITMSVPEEVGGTATPDVLELESRAKLLAGRVVEILDERGENERG